MGELTNKINKYLYETNYDDEDDILKEMENDVEIAIKLIREEFDDAENDLYRKIEPIIARYKRHYGKNNDIFNDFISRISEILESFVSINENIVERIEDKFF